METRKFAIRNILIPYDFSETAALALEHAVFMAKLCKAQISLLHVIETYSFTSAISHAFSKSQSEFESKIEESTKVKLQEIADAIHKKSAIQVKFTTEVGSIYKQIVKVAHDIHANIIIMGTHGASGFQEFLMGSNAFRVVTSSPCPVITVQSHAKKIGFKDIVLPIDDSIVSRQKIVYAVELAKHYSSTIHIAGLRVAKNADFVRKFEIKVRQVEDYCKEHNVLCTKKMFDGDDIAKMSLAYSDDINADLIIIMTEQEANPGFFNMGSAAQSLVNHSKVPVMSIRPLATDPSKITISY
ncbi:MAG TPA: universal stress protein [Bacteroidia bacterium]|nr:universal stress protein [Bacteroidia bacterium]